MIVFPLYPRNWGLNITLALSFSQNSNQTESDLADCFQVDHWDAKEIPVPFNQALVETDNVAEWAQRYRKFLQAFTEAILAAALPSEIDQSAMLNRIYAQVEHRLATAPSRYPFHYISIFALLTRR